VRASNRSVGVLPCPLEEPAGVRSAKDVWGRQVRWARIRRECFPYVFVFEVFAGGLFPLIAVAVAAHSYGYSMSSAVLAQCLLWYGAELAFLSCVGWHLSTSSLPAALVRDLMLPVQWILAWRSGPIVWRGRPVYGGAAS